MYKIHPRAQTAKSWDGNVGQKLRDIVFSNNFLDMVPKAQTADDNLDSQSYNNMCNAYVGEDVDNGAFVHCWL